MPTPELTMPKMQTITLYDPVSGLLGPVITADDDAICQYTFDPDCTWLEGAHDIKALMLDVATGGLVARTAPPPQLHEIQARRNQLLDSYRWTVMPDSPLTTQNQADWLQWLKSLQSLLVKYPNGENLIWPEKPEYHYA